MSLLAVLFAVALSAGNAEFERTAAEGAADIAIDRIAAELSAKGASAGALTKAMLADPQRFASRVEAESACRAIYEKQVDAEFAAAAEAVRKRLSLGKDYAPKFASAQRTAALGRFAAAFAEERTAACATQAKGIAGTVRPSEADFETKDEAALRKEMTAKVAAQQKGGVFEENLGYISKTVVDPVIASARAEMKRQRDYLMRTRCEAYAPSLLAKELEANLRKNVEERRAKESDPSKAWGVFPKTLAEGIPEATARRTLERVTRCADDVPVRVDAADISAAIAKDPKLHRKAADSEKAFRGAFEKAVLDGALARAEREAPEPERKEFAAYVRAHAGEAAIGKVVEARVRRELIPELRKVREEIARADFAHGWPQLANGTWYPDAELADTVAARSDYQKAVGGWRKMAELSDLSLRGAKAVRLVETDALADKAVAGAFDRARDAIAAQNAILTAAEPEVLGEAKDRKASFWRRTPDYKKIMELLTEAVEDRWDEARVETLWPDAGTRPENAEDQHAAIFPSVRKRIELIAKSILEEMEKPENPSESDQQTEDPLTMFSITVAREGDRVKVKLDQGKSTVAEKTAKARMSDYQGAMKYVSDKLGKEILKLK